MLKENIRILNNISSKYKDLPKKTLLHQYTEEIRKHSSKNSSENIYEPRIKLPSISHISHQNQDRKQKIASEFVIIDPKIVVKENRAEE